MAKLDGLSNTFSQRSHSCCCPLFLFPPLFVAVFSFRNFSFCCSTTSSKATSSSSSSSSHHHHQVFAHITTPVVLLSLPSKPSSRFPLVSDVDSSAGCSLSDFFFFFFFFFLFVLILSRRSKCFSMKHFSPTHEPQNKTHNITTT